MQKKETNFEDNVSQKKLQEMEDYFLTLVRKGIQEANKNTTTPPSVQEYSKAILLKLKIAGAIASAETKLVNESRKLPLFESLMQFEFVDRGGAKFTEQGIIPKARAEKSLTISPLKNMIFVPISSSWIAEIGFDYINHDLYIHYKKQSKQGNDLYKYEKVDEGEYVKILRSRGRDRYNAIMIIVKRYEDTVLRLGKRSQMKEVPIAEVPTVDQTVTPTVEASTVDLTVGETKTVISKKKKTKTKKENPNPKNLEKIVKIDSIKSTFKDQPELKDTLLILYSDAYESFYDILNSKEILYPEQLIKKRDDKILELITKIRKELFFNDIYKKITNRVDQIKIINETKDQNIGLKKRYDPTKEKFIREAAVHADIDYGKSILR